MTPDPEHNPRAENKAAFGLTVYIFCIVAVSSVLLIVNTAMVFSLTQGTSSLLPAIPMLAQILVFTLPMLLLYLEWYLWDVFAARLLRSRS